jgi:predicted Rossmann-fold nucleotide-binding protein
MVLMERQFVIDDLKLGESWRLFRKLFEVLTLIQIHRIKPFPIICVGSQFWGGLLDWAKDRLLTNELISPEDLDIVTVLDDPAAVVDAVKKVVIV